jgi:alpha-tubulin suppressor-like RCC1 family protein
MDDTDLTNAFLTIPLEEIKKYLRCFKLEIPRDPTKAYQLVWKFLVGHPDCSIPSVYVNDFVTARDLQGRITERCSVSSILRRPERELGSLAQALRLSGVNREKMFRILGYLNLLDHDMTFFDLLPLDIWRIIGMNLDCLSLCFLRRTNQKMASLITPDELREIVRIKVEKITRMELTDYTKEELGFLFQRSLQSSRLSNRGRSSMILTPERQVFGCGYNFYGQLGLGDTRDRNAHTPIDTSQIGKITAIATGPEHTLFLNNQGRVFSVGNSSDGQLGIEDVKSHRIQLHLGKNGVNAPIIPIDSPILGSVTAIAAGGKHSLFLNSQGQVFSCGDNADGQLGLGDTESKLVPTWLFSIRMETIIAIAAGSSHSLLLNSEGQVLSFGFGGWGQLGLDDDGNRLLPVVIGVPENQKIVAIAAGNHFSLILNSQGQVYGFGSNESGQLGIDDDEDQYIPVPIRCHEMGKIVAISAGGGHSLLLNIQGQVFGCGENGCGQLGQGEIEEWVPIRIQSDLWGKVMAISAGLHHSLIMNNKNQIFGFGRNQDGELGIGDNKNRNRPTLIMDLGNLRVD